MRRSASSVMDDPAPCAESDRPPRGRSAPSRAPSSFASDSSVDAAHNAERDAWHFCGLSSRPLKMYSLRAPPMTLGCASHSWARSQAASLGSQSNSSAKSSRRIGWWRLDAPSLARFASGAAAVVSVAVAAGVEPEPSAVSTASAMAGRRSWKFTSNPSLTTGGGWRGSGYA